MRRIYEATEFNLQKMTKLANDLVLRTLTQILNSDYEVYNNTIYRVFRALPADEGQVRQRYALSIQELTAMHSMLNYALRIPFNDNLKFTNFTRNLVVLLDYVIQLDNLNRNPSTEQTRVIFELCDNLRHWKHVKGSYELLWFITRHSNMIIYEQFTTDYMPCVDHWQHIISSMDEENQNLLVIDEDNTRDWYPTPHFRLLYDLNGRPVSMSEWRNINLNDFRQMLDVMMPVWVCFSIGFFFRIFSRGATIEHSLISTKVREIDSLVYQDVDATCGSLSMQNILQNRDEYNNIIGFGFSPLSWCNLKFQLTSGAIKIINTSSSDSTRTKSNDITLDKQQNVKYISESNIGWLENYNLLTITYSANVDFNITMDMANNDITLPATIEVGTCTINLSEFIGNNLAGSFGFVIKSIFEGLETKINLSELYLHNETSDEVLDLLTESTFIPDADTFGSTVAIDDEDVGYLINLYRIANPERPMNIPYDAIGLNSDLESYVEFKNITPSFVVNGSINRPNLAAIDLVSDPMGLDTGLNRFYVINNLTSYDNISSPNLTLTLKSQMINGTTTLTITSDVDLEHVTDAFSANVTTERIVGDETITYTSNVNLITRNLGGNKYSLEFDEDLLIDINGRLFNLTKNIDDKNSLVTFTKNGGNIKLNGVMILDVIIFATNTFGEFVDSWVVSGKSVRLEQMSPLLKLSLNDGIVYRNLTSGWDWSGLFSVNVTYKANNPVILSLMSLGEVVYYIELPISENFIELNIPITAFNLSDDIKSQLILPPRNTNEVLTNRNYEMFIDNNMMQWMDYLCPIVA